MYLVSVQTQNPFKSALLAGTVLASISLAGVASAQSVGAQSLGNAGGAGLAGLTAIALPSGGKVTAGQAQIISSGSATTINQSSNKAILTWDQFSIGQGGLVQFNNGSGATLNRVIGTSLSSIDGRLSASGTVYLINPNGIVIGAKGIIDTGGSFIASTQNINDANFLSGGPPQFTGTSTASVINLGKVSSLGGNVALIATKVSNEGSISAANGTAGLLAGTSVLLRDSALDDGLFLVQAGGTDTSVTQKGAIEAAAAELKAQNGSVYALAGNTASYIKATGTGTKGGQIWLLAGADGTTTVSGTNLKATNGDKGGFIETSGGTVKVADDVSIATQAANGAFGTWLIDPNDLIIAPTGGFMSGAALSTALAANNVTLKSNQGTTAGNGDIFINDTVTWSSSSKLTLDAYRNININKVITVAGAGGVNLIVGDQAQNGTGDATKGDYSFGLSASGFAGRIDYTGTGGSLSINGQTYTLIYNFEEFLKTDGSTNSFAMANHITQNKQPVFPPYNSNLVFFISSLTGNLVGLGHDINFKVSQYGNRTFIAGKEYYTPNNFTIINQIYGTIRDIKLNSAVSTDSYYGFASTINQNSTLKNMMLNASSTCTATCANLSTNNYGLVSNIFGTSSASRFQPMPSEVGSGGPDGRLPGAPTFGQASGLVTNNIGTLSNSIIGGYVGSADYSYSFAGDRNTYNTGIAAGLVGVNYGNIINVDSTTNVAGISVGGIVYENKGAINNVHYIGTVGSDGSLITGQYASQGVVGGVAAINSGNISNSYSSGSILGTFIVFNDNQKSVGGLVGINNSTILNSYSTSSVYSSGISGGLVGTNLGSISSAFATGVVTNYHYGVCCSYYSGGLVGSNQGSITNAYALGPVSGIIGNIDASFTLGSGGLVGSNTGTIDKAYSIGTVTEATEPANPTGPGGLVGSGNGSVVRSYWDSLTSGQALSRGGTGRTTSQLQGTLPSGFDPAIWGSGPGLYPYLKVFGTPKPISGIITDSNNKPLPLNYGSAGVYQYLILPYRIDIYSNLGQSYTFAGNNGYYYYQNYTQFNQIMSGVGATISTERANTLNSDFLQYSYSDIINSNNGGISNLNIKVGNFNVFTSKSSLSTIQAALNSTFGSATYNAILSNPAITRTRISALGGLSLDANFTTSQALVIEAMGGDLTLASGGSVSSTATGDAVVLAANGGFFNNASAGAGAISTPNGRWLVSTTTPEWGSDTLGGLVGKNYYGATYSFGNGFSKAPTSGNRFVHAYRPILTVTGDVKTATYTGATQGFTYTLTGYRPGDQATDVVSGSALTAKTTSKNVGTYTQNTTSSFVSDLNYGFSYVSPAIINITPAPLTLAAVTDTKTYDSTATSTKAVLKTGLKGSDTVTGLSQAFDSRNAGARTLTINSSYVINDGNGGANYTPTVTNATGTINKAALTLTASTDTKTYDTTTSSVGTVTVAGLKGADYINNIYQVFDSKNAGARTLKANTDFAVYDSYTGENLTANYQPAYKTAVGTINKAPLTLAAVTDSKVYDATTSSSATPYASGFLGTDTISKFTQSFDSKNAGPRSLVIKAGYLISDGNSGNNYAVTVNYSAGQITPAPLTLAAVTDTKTYDTTTTSTKAVLKTGLKGSDTVTGLSQAFDNKNAGARSLVVNPGYVINDGNNGLNYTVGLFGATGTINKASLTLTAATDTKTYDTTTSSVGTVTVAGLKGADGIYNLYQVFDSKNAGARTLKASADFAVYDPYTGENLTANYQPAYKTAVGTINKAPLTLAAVADSKAYDGKTTSIGVVQIYGLLGTDKITSLAQVFDSAAKGNRKLSVKTGYVIDDGNGGKNYSVGTQQADGVIY